METKRNKEFEKFWYSPEMIDFKYMFIFIKDESIAFLKKIKVIK